MPAVGGAPRRLTFHPGGTRCWAGPRTARRALPLVARDHPHDDWTLRTIALTGGDPVRLPLFRARTADP